MADTSYKYQGITFTKGLSWASHCSNAALHSKTAIFGVLKIASKLGNISHELYFKIFEIAHILLNGGEVWGFCQNDYIECVHTLACKRFLSTYLQKIIYSSWWTWSVSPIHPSIEKGNKVLVKIIEYTWLLSSQTCYHMTLLALGNNRVIWASRCRDLLYRLGFDYVRIQQSVNAPSSFWVLIVWLTLHISIKV